MKQLLQNLDSGKTELVEEPFPRTKNGHVLVQTRASLISAGTERMPVEFGKAGRIYRLYTAFTIFTISTASMISLQ